MPSQVKFISPSRTARYETAISLTCL